MLHIKNHKENIKHIVFVFRDKVPEGSGPGQTVGPVQGCQNPVLKRRDPARFSDPPGGNS